MNALSPWSKVVPAPTPGVMQWRDYKNDYSYGKAKRERMHHKADHLWDKGKFNSDRCPSELFAVIMKERHRLCSEDLEMQIEDHKASLGTCQGDPQCLQLTKNRKVPKCDLWRICTGCSSPGYKFQDPKKTYNLCTMCVLRTLHDIGGSKYRNVFGIRVPPIRHSNTAFAPYQLIRPDIESEKWAPELIQTIMDVEKADRLYTLLDQFYESKAYEVDRLTQKCHCRECELARAGCQDDGERGLCPRYCRNVIRHIWNWDYVKHSTKEPVPKPLFEAIEEFLTLMPKLREDRTYRLYNDKPTARDGLLSLSLVHPPQREWDCLPDPEGVLQRNWEETGGTIMGSRLLNLFE